jgi:hypothetical protein
MTGPRLEDMQDDDLDAACMAALGDTIRYKPVGGAYRTLSAYVSYADAIRDIETGQMIAQDITVDMLIADVPVKPSGQCRLTLARLSGLTFRPINVRRDNAGTHWQFEVEKVNA